MDITYVALFAEVDDDGELHQVALSKNGEAILRYLLSSGAFAEEGKSIELIDEVKLKRVKDD